MNGFLKAPLLWHFFFVIKIQLKLPCIDRYIHLLFMTRKQKYWKQKTLNSLDFHNKNLPYGYDKYTRYTLKQNINEENRAFCSHIVPFGLFPLLHSCIIWHQISWKECFTIFFLYIYIYIYIRISLHFTYII